MQSVHEIINYINGLPPSTWTSVGSYLAGSTIVASLLQVLKHKFKFADAQKFIVFMLGFLSFMVAFADFLLQSQPILSALPWLGHVTAAIMGFAVVVHRFAVSPAYYRLSNKLNQFNSLLKEAEKGEQPVGHIGLATAAPGVAPSPVLPDESSLDQFQV